MCTSSRHMILSVFGINASVWISNLMSQTDAARPEVFSNWRGTPWNDFKLARHALKWTTYEMNSHTRFNSFVFQMPCLSCAVCGILCSSSCSILLELRLCVLCMLKVSETYRRFKLNVEMLLLVLCEVGKGRVSTTLFGKKRGNGTSGRATSHASEFTYRRYSWENRGGTKLDVHTERDWSDQQHFSTLLSNLRNPLAWSSPLLRRTQFADRNKFHIS